MAVGDVTQGWRVDDMDDLSPGAYCLGKVQIEGVSHDYVRFILPTATPGSKWFEHDKDNPHDGLHAVSSNIWQITEHEDGTVTISPSIGCGPSPYYWHGYLEHGIWREV